MSSNNFYKSTEKLQGELKPYQWVQLTRPIVILDEPQNMNSEKAKEAIEAAGLEVPTTGTARGGDRSGAMSEYRGYILAEMQSLARRHPGASW